jgi:hypothetical protein
MIFANGLKDESYYWLPVCSRNLTFYGAGREYSFKKYFSFEKWRDFSVLNLQVKFSA